MTTTTRVTPSTERPHLINAYIITIAMIGSMIGLRLGHLSASAHPLSPVLAPSAGHLYDTLRVIRHPQGADHALTYLRSRSAQELRVMYTRGLERALMEHACITAEHLERLEPRRASRAIKALSVISRFEMIQGDAQCLTALWRHTMAQGDSARRAYGHLLKDLIAREAVEAIYRLGRIDLLRGATSHPDPHIRALAARSGVEPTSLCSLSEDAWPAVRLSAARGIARVAGVESLCLVRYLSDSELSVRITALRGIGRLAAEPWATSADVPLDEVFTSLRTIASDSEAALDERSAALTALARWGATQVAEQLLRAHLERGGLLELSRAALYAVAISADHPLTPLKRVLERSPSLALRGYAATLLADSRLKWSERREELLERLKLMRGVIDELSGAAPRLALKLEERYRDLETPNPHHQRDRAPRDLAPRLDEEDD